MPKKYTDEFKKTAVELVESGLSQKQVCADLGISKSALQVWVRDAQLEERGIEPVGDAEGRREQAAMLKRIKELETENLILRKATAYLSQANLKLGGQSPK
ncbi:IS3 family transposase [Microbacterium indicum]|uniref:IS3 family transposase n=1 Tax=Microbacterium indicum TaxID=358100 RepID=UPI00041A69CA|nr:IS3 family transposase [Microbacterium indicum]